MTLGAGRLRVAGEVRVLGDKSISHRALLLAALGGGRSRIRGVLRAADTESTAGALRALGVAVDELSDTTLVHGRGLRGLLQPSAPLNCGNSGTTARLLLGILAAQRVSTTLDGDDSLRRRPMRRVAEPLRTMGATIELPPHDGLPVTISGADLRPLDWTTPVASAQIKSAILFAGLCGGVQVTVREPHLSRDHSERMLSALGVPVETSRDADGSATVSLVPAEGLTPVDLQVPGDPSSAAFFAALAAMSDAGEVVLRDIALNPTRTGFIDVLRRMGASIAVHEGPPAAERLGDLAVRAGSTLRATTIEGAEVPSLIDEIPLLACVAARAEGETLIRGASELRVKESDRIAAIVGNLRAVGAEADELPDGLRVHGSPEASLRGTVRTFGDHRIAMAFATLGAASGRAIEIDDPACVAVSYPEFWRDLARLIA